MKPLDVLLIGAGKRGYHVYGDYGLRFPHKLRYVAVAEPNENRRKSFANKFGIPPEGCFSTWEELIDKPKLADAAFIVTLDKLHFAPTIEMLRQGYDVIVEKPMAVKPAKCVSMVETAKKFNRLLSIGHVLRFTPFYQEIYKIIHSGQLGEIVNINQTECVGFWHFAGSFVRGNFAKTSESAPSILTKCCHDLDIIRWLAGSPVKTIASFGNLFEFRPEKAPGNVPERCTDGCEHEAECPYSARRLYVDTDRYWLNQSFKNYCGPNIAPYEKLPVSPHSRCVYLGQNDVCDQQVVMMECESGVIATLTMQAHTRDDTRTLRISGTRGELHGHLIKNDIIVRDFTTDKQIRITPEVIESGHMGGDIILIDKFIEAAQCAAGEHLSSAYESLESHLLAFAAEKARQVKKIINMVDYKNEIWESAKKALPHF